MAISTGNFIVLGGEQTIGILSSESPFILDNIIETPLMAFALRKLSGIYTGPIIRIRRASDNAEADFNFDSNNEFSVGGSLSSNTTNGTDGQTFTFWGASVDTFVVKWYTQVGTNDIENTTTSQQWTFNSASAVFNGIESRTYGYTPNSTISGNSQYSNYFVSRKFNQVTYMAMVKTDNTDSLVVVEQNLVFQFKIDSTVNNTTILDVGNNPVVGYIELEDSGGECTLNANTVTPSWTETVSNFEAELILGRSTTLAMSDDFFEYMLFDSINSSDKDKIRPDESDYYGIAI